jgi:hypothetical protein
MQVMDTRCQCVPIYRGKKVDKHTGIIVGCSDYRNASYSNDRKNQRHGQQGRNGSHQTGISRRLSKDTNQCPFSLNVFQDTTGYFLTTKGSGGYHQHHPRRDHLCHSSSHLHQEETQLQHDINTARAKIGTTSSQVAWLCKKKELASKGGKTTGIMTGEIDDIYKYLKQSSNYLLCLSSCPWLNHSCPAVILLQFAVAMTQYLVKIPPGFRLHPSAFFGEINTTCIVCHPKMTIESPRR